MYADVFFLTLKDTIANVKTSWSDKDIERILYSEIKSDQYNYLRQTYVKENRDFPAFNISNCPILEKNLALMVRNNAIVYSMNDDAFKVCKNYVMSE